MTQKVLLLNPPGKRAYIRDYYCSKIAKSNYCPHPIDLLMLSGRLSEFCQVQVMDTIAEPMELSLILKKIDAFAPDVIISQIGAVSLEEDSEFLARVSLGRRIAVTGDVVLEDAEGWLRKHPDVDAAILDFTSADIVAYVKGEMRPLPSIVTRADLCRTVARTRPKQQEFVMPLPRHDLFVSSQYRFPFVRRREFATVLTDYGCPFTCTFCNMGGIGYRYRSVDNVVDELRYLQTLGKKELFFIDQSFGANKVRAIKLCTAMAKEGMHFGWVCFSRVDLLDEELLDAMQQAGCHTVMFGVESADQSLLDLYRKGSTVLQARETFKLCRARRIRTVATFILGLPEETAASAKATIAFAKELDPDFVSFNVAVPRIATLLRRQAIEDGLTSSDVTTMDQSGTSIAMPTRYLTKEEVQRIRRQAILAFYGRPAYLWRRLTSVASFQEFCHHLVNGWGMIGNLWTKGGP
jgi:radical SAM superfamily enzyme YgiQ (UPF0313 family)